LVVLPLFLIEITRISYIKILSSKSSTPHHMSWHFINKIS
jgi:hypothetical protein